MFDLVGLLFSINASPNLALSNALPACKTSCLPLSSQTAKTQTSLRPSLAKVFTTPKASNPTYLAAAQNELMPLAAKILPSNVVGVIFLNTDLAVWQQLQEVTPFGTEAAQAFDGLLQLKGIGFSQDIQPWLTGHLAIAILPIVPPPVTAKNKTQTIFPQALAKPPSLNFVGIIPVKDKDKLESFLGKLEKVPGRKTTVEEYQGIKVRLWEPIAKPSQTKCLNSSGVKCDDAKNVDSSPTKPTEQDPNEEFSDEFDLDFLGLNKRSVAIAQFPDYLIVSTQVASVRQAIDLQGQGASLGESSLFLRTFNQPEWQRSFLSGYANYAQTVDFFINNAPQLEASAIDPTALFAQDTITALRATAAEFNSLDFFMWGEANGLRSRATSYYITPNLKNVADASTTTHDILNRLPASTLTSISSRNFKNQWSWILGEFKSQPSLNFIIAGIREFTTSVIGLDIDKDIAPWMTGEYAAILFPSDRGLFPTIDINLGFGLLIQTSDRFAANAALAKLTRFIDKGSNGSLTVAKRQVGDRTFTSWEVLDPANKAASRSVFAYGWSDDRTLLITSGLGPLSAMYPKPANSLASSTIFQSTIKDIPTSNFGYFFVNNAGWVDFVVRNVPKEYLSEIPTSALNGLKRLRGMTLVYSATPDKFQSDFFFGVAPK